MDTYHIPTALTVLSAIFLIIGAICAIVVTADILWRRGWRSMMGIMYDTAFHDLENNDH